MGESGLEVLERRLPQLIRDYSADFVIVNGENAAEGFGLTAPLLERIFASGADVVSSGNHIWEKREFWPVLDSQKRLLRPLNYNTECPGIGWTLLEKPSPWGGQPVNWLAVNLQGREHMTPIDCPFRSFDLLEAELKSKHSTKNPVILVDFHAESSREKEALAYYLDGRVSVIAGTHTHVQTADERILPRGTAYITDLGMTGPLDGVIGMKPSICLERARTQVLHRMEVAAPAEADGINADCRTAVQGIIAEIDAENLKALSVKRLSV